MAKLSTASQFADPRGLSGAPGGAAEFIGRAGGEVDSRFVLILANHIGDLDVLREAIALAEAAA